MTQTFSCILHSSVNSYKTICAGRFCEKRMEKPQNQ